MDMLVAVPFVNTVLCVITSFYIWKLQSADPTHENDFIHLYKDTVREVKAIYTAFKKKHKTEITEELNDDKGEQYES